MTLALASTWHPRGELQRLRAMLPTFLVVYEAIVVVLPPDVQPHVLADLETPGAALADLGQFRAVVSPDWSWGRHVALSRALESTASHIHYADLDRLLRWVETRPEEWRQTVRMIEQHDCLIVGRTESAYRTHPQALVRTEAISNRVAASLLGKPVDVSAGCKGFSRGAAEFLVAHSQPGRALGVDAEWPVLLQRAGYHIEYAEVDGLDWEIPDQYQLQAADPDRQARLAREYDTDPRNWARRVEVALEIVHCGLEADRRRVEKNQE